MRLLGLSGSKRVLTVARVARYRSEIRAGRMESPGRCKPPSYLRLSGRNRRGNCLRWSELSATPKLMVESVPSLT